LISRFSLLAWQLPLSSSPGVNSAYLNNAKIQQRVNLSRKTLYSRLQQPPIHFHTKTIQISHSETHFNRRPRIKKRSAIPSQRGLPRPDSRAFRPGRESLFDPPLCGASPQILCRAESQHICILPNFRYHTTSPPGDVAASGRFDERTRPRNRNASGHALRNRISHNLEGALRLVAVTAAGRDNDPELFISHQMTSVPSLIRKTAKACRKNQNVARSFSGPQRAFRPDSNRPSGF
jgi:hypothetical protein